MDFGKKYSRKISLGMVALIAACAPAKFEKVPTPEAPLPAVCQNDPAKCPNITPTSVTVKRDVVVGASSKNVDILIIDDNSRSMQTEQANMAAKFPTFVQALNSSLGGQLDWRVGIVTTDMSTGGIPNGCTRTANTNPSFSNGNLVNGVFLTKDTPDVFTEFEKRIQMTIDSGGGCVCGSGDERGIYAALTAVNNNENNWIRKDASLEVIILSDEDERSDAGQTSPGNALEAGKDYPADLIAAVRTKFGADKKLTVHSIIVQPGDTNCRNIQDNQPGGSGSYGEQYAQLSTMTGGVNGDVCAKDYGSQLTAIGTIIPQTLSSINLDCVPMGNTVFVTPKTPPTLQVTPTVNGDKLYFNPPLPEGSVVHLEYTCPR